MKAEERRAQILWDLTVAEHPVSATKLAEKYSVSRQIVVGDIALLRAAGEDIIATPRGYISAASQSSGMHGATKNYTIACVHSNNRQMEDEMNTLVDNGCYIINVIVEHPVYGQIVAQLNCGNRHDVAEFIHKVESVDAVPLSDLTNGLHLHTVRCPDEETYERVVEELRGKGLMYE